MAKAKPKSTLAGKDSQKAVCHESATVPSEPLGAETVNASELIDRRIEELGDWRGEMLARIRQLILETDSGIAEQWKWSNPVWAKNGILCTGEAYKKVVKLTFAHGAKIKDPKGLFNSSLQGNLRRAIDIAEGQAVDPRAFKSLIKAAVAFNTRSSKS